MPKRYTKEEKAFIADGLKGGKSPKSIAAEIGCNVKYIYYFAKKDNIDYERFADQIDDMTRAMREYKAQGHSYKEVMERFNCSRDFAHNRCKGIAPQPNQYERNGYSREKNLVQHLEERAPFFEFVGGYPGEGGIVKLRCKKCGDITERTYAAARAGKICCRNCKEIEQKKRREKKKTKKLKAERDRRKILKRKQAEEKRQKRIEQEAKKHECCVCGKITTKPKYCSVECRNKAGNKRHETARRIRMQSRMVDKDITLRGLYRRDKGQCYICGLLCLWDDYIVVNGTTICGEWYPSIDHVVPLSKGGDHSWKNVRLAHRRCNSMKGTDETRRVESTY